MDVYLYMWGALIGALVGLAIGNYGWQFCTERNWGQATERTWFQFVALGTVALSLFARQLAGH